MAAVMEERVIMVGTVLGTVQVLVVVTALARGPVPITAMVPVTALVPMALVAVTAQERGTVQDNKQQATLSFSLALRGPSSRGTPTSNFWVLNVNQAHR